MSKSVDIKFKKQKEFPYLNQFKQEFPVDEYSVFVLGDTIYTNHEIPYDIYFHEQKHIQQQKKIGEKVWIDLYLSNPKWRLEIEIEAYKYQLLKVKEHTNNDREELNNIKQECIRNLTSGFYGEKLTYPEAVKALKI